VRKDRGAWVNYVGRSDRFDNVGVVNDNWQLKSEGIQFGTDLHRTRNSQFGLHFGYEEGRLASTNWFGRTDWVKGEDYYFGVYGARVLRGGYDVRGVFTYGQQDYSMFRWGADDLTHYSTPFKGHTAEVNLEVGRRMLFPDRWTSFVDRQMGRLYQKIRRGNCDDTQLAKRGPAGLWTYRPVVAMDVFNSNLRGATETDDDVWHLNQSEAVIYDRASLTQVYLRTGSDLQYQWRNLLLNGGLYYAYDVNGQGARTRVTAQEDADVMGNENIVGGLPLTGVLTSSKLGRSLVTFNFGGSCRIGSCMTVFASYQGEYATDRANKQIHNIGQAGVGYRW